MVIGKIICPCQTINCINRDILLQEFRAIREKCAALREILVPDTVWEDFKQRAKASPDTVGHKYKVLGALQLGILSKITFPIHRYLMDGNSPKEELKNNYKKELIEDWIKEETPLKRHKKAREHEGKINELLCALWLENQGWKIDKLEALNGDFDIEATSTDNISYSIEVKFIGQEDRKFQEFEKSCTSRNAIADTIPIYDGYNYFLFRTYEAAWQLSKSTRKRLALIVFSHLTWGFNEVPIKESWILSRPITFSKQASEGWDAFLNSRKEEKRYHDIDNTLGRYVEQLNELWVMQQNGDLEYSLEKTFKFSKQS